MPLPTSIRSLVHGALVASCIAVVISSRSTAAEVVPRAMHVELPESCAPAADALRQRVYEAAEKNAHSLLPLVRPWDVDGSMSLMTDSKSDEHWIRPNAGMIEGLAFLYRFGPYDESIVGCSREELLQQYLLPMMRYLVATHVTGDQVTGDGNPWGDAWQSAHWATKLGLAAWWLDDSIPDELRQAVRRVVAHEADRFVVATPPHNLHRDTKAEENAWNSRIFSVAVLLMPDDPRRSKWEAAFQRWAMSSFLRPADEHSNSVVDGRTVAEQFTGANIFDDFTLENHGRVHPSYMGAFELTLGCTLHYRLTGRQPPEALQYNTAGIYKNLKWFCLPDGEMVYPNGQDWALFDSPSWLSVHLLMANCMDDPDAWSLAHNSFAALERMQARHSSGAIYGEDENFFASSRADLFSALGRCWLLLSTVEKVRDAPRLPRGTRYLQEAKIVLQRTDQSINSLSWGSRVMIMCVPLRLDRIISPDSRSGVGEIVLENKKRLPVRASLEELQCRDDSFAADLIVVHGDNLVQARLHVETTADGELILREELVALADVTTSRIATGLVGVLNNPHWIYERGVRDVTFDDEAIAFRALAGQQFASTTARKICIDKTYQVDSDAPLSVCYIGASEMERSRATDKLFLNYHDRTRSWKKGDTISSYSVRITPQVR